jgi:hypothetical protein
MIHWRPDQARQSTPNAAARETLKGGKQSIQGMKIGA